PPGTPQSLRDSPDRVRFGTPLCRLHSPQGSPRVTSRPADRPVGRVVWATAESAPPIRRSLGERHATILTDPVATDQTDGQQGSANPPGWGPEARAYAHG